MVANRSSGPFQPNIHGFRKIYFPSSNLDDATKPVESFFYPYKYFLISVFQMVRHRGVNYKFNIPVLMGLPFFLLGAVCGGRWIV